MAKASRIFEVGGQRAADRVYALIGQLGILLGSLPHIPEAFSPDDLPIAFILRRDSPQNQGRLHRRRNKTPPFVREADSHSTARAAGRRPAGAKHASTWKSSSPSC
jgi:hypothetical protein